MRLYVEIPRPHASFACPACRAVNIVEPEDLSECAAAVVELDCLKCGSAHRVHVAYMLEQFSRDLAAA